VQVRARNDCARRVGGNPRRKGNARRKYSACRKSKMVRVLYVAVGQVPWAKAGAVQRKGR